VTPEGEAYLRYLAIVRDGMFHELEAVPRGALNWPLRVPETNTLYASAFHASMSARSWIIVRAGRGAIERDRDAEFKASGTLEQLRAHWEETLAMCRPVVNRLVEADYLKFRRMIFQATGLERDGTVRDCLLHAIEHCNIHLGHIQLARQLYEAGVSGPPS